MLNRIYIIPFHFVTLFYFMQLHFIYLLPLLYLMQHNCINKNPVFQFCFGCFITCFEGVKTSPHLTNYKKLFLTPQKFT